MNANLVRSVIMGLALSGSPVVATTHYVDLNNSSPAPPYLSWATAATNIQEAIDVAVTGDEVLVTNGVYQTGGKVLTSNYTNRIAINQPLTVRSVNGPAVTIIRGVPGIGPDAARCAYLNEGATLSGFTLADGGTRNKAWPMPITTYWGGGVFCVSGAAVVTNCVIVGNAADESAGGVYSGTLIDCEISGNYAGYHGGGAFRSSLTRCRLNSNQSWNYGGGAEACALTTCVLSNNYAGLMGGGAYQSSLDRCRVLNNSSWWGAGIQECTANNSMIMGNSAYEGGGARSSGLINCALVQNASGTVGGGALGGSLVNCTITGNTASTGGGAYESTADNCILYFNSAPIGANYSGGLLNWSCTTPLPASGTNNFTTDPQLADNFHLTASSTCLGAGNSSLASGLDIDGEGWLNPPAVGCDQFYSGGATGVISLSLRADQTNVATGFSVNFTAQIDGHATSCQWNFGDGTIVSNQPWTTHSWLAGGDYAAVFTVYNESFPLGVSETLTVHIQPALHYVSLASTNPVAPYSTWGTAATNIQDAVDASFFGSTIIVSNGNYAVGGRVVGGSCTNRLVVTEGLLVQSLNGPVVTAIQGYQDPVTTNGPNAVRCVWLRPNTRLIGFTLTNGATATDFSGEGPDPNRNGGGGLRGEDPTSVASRCVLAGNASAYYAGGAYGGTLNQCLLFDNLTGGYGGGAYSSALNNCTLARNLAADYGGGAMYSTLTNCVVHFNSAPTGPDQQDCEVNFCCLSNPSGGWGNITNTPSFADLANDNFRLQTNSPCVNAGKNPDAPTDLDLGGNPRIAGGTVDIGAYEFQSPSSALSYAWAQRYGLSTDGSADFADPDTDGMNNYGEWRSDTVPTNSLSVLRMVSATNGATGANVTWQSVATRSYWLERATNLGVSTPFQTVATNLSGVAGLRIFSDTSATNGGPYFYRIGVQ